MITGFPSPAQGYESKGIDLNSVLIKHPSATVFMQIESSSYTHMGIFNGDILIVDRAKKITPSSLVMITLLDIMPAQYQGWLWIAPMEDIKKKRLMDAVDHITDAYGRHTITLGKSFIKDGWQMKREFLSPCVTTDIKCIPGIN